MTGIFVIKTVNGKSAQHTLAAVRLHILISMVFNTAVIPVEPCPGSSPSATRGACGRRMSSLPADRTVRERPHQAWGRGRAWGRSEGPRFSLGCIDQHRPPGKCQSWQWEIRTESLSVLGSRRRFPLVLWQAGNRERGPPGKAWTSLLRMPESCGGCRMLQRGTLLHCPLNNDK